MATQTFSKSGSTITVNGYSTDNPPHYKIEADNSNHLVLINADDESFVLQVSVITDTITINGSPFSGTATQLRTQLLSDIFANSSSGGTGGAPVLQSPDTTLWQIGVNDSGALQTTQVASGTAGTLHLFSPDNTEWNVTVNNAGALITTAI